MANLWCQLDRTCIQLKEKHLSAQVYDGFS